jgi:hypothetical protein
MAVTKIDLESVDPRGRVDVVAYRGAELLAKKAEEKYGLKGIWDILKPHANVLATRYLSGIDIPLEAQILISLLQANVAQQAVVEEKKL